MAACQRGKDDIVKVLLADTRVQINTRAPNGSSPFFTACILGHVAVVKLMLADDRVDINVTNNGGYTPIILCCEGASRVGLSLINKSINKCRDTSNNKHYQRQHYFLFWCFSIFS